MKGNPPNDAQRTAEKKQFPKIICRVLSSRYAQNFTGRSLFTCT